MEAAKILVAVSAGPATDAIRGASSREHSATIDVVAYLEAIADGTVSGRSQAGKILLRRDFAVGLALPLSKAVPLGLIVGELVTNAIKYAHPAGVAGVIKVGSSRHDGAIVIEVSDDGVGLPEGLEPLGAVDAGLAMVRRVAAQLGAAISFDDHGLGLSCALRIPYADIAPYDGASDLVHPRPELKVEHG